MEQKKQDINGRDLEPAVQEWVSRLTDEAMKQNQAFAREHWKDSCEELAAYVRACAEKLGHTPYPVEVIGSPFIASRFVGGWAHALRAAGLPRLPGRSIERVRWDRAAEYNRQLKHYILSRPGMAEGREIARRAYAEIGLKPFTKIPPEMKEAYQKAKGRQRYLYLTEKLPKNPDGTPRKAQTRGETLERDRQWAKKHRHDTDEEFLEYLRRTAEEMGYTPQMREIVGGHYIGQRFCGWNIAVTLAGLPLGRKMKKPTTQQMQMYENRCANRAKMSAEAKASLNQ